MRVLVQRVAFLRAFLFIVVGVSLAISVTPRGAYGARPAPTPRPTPVAAVIQVTVIPVARAAHIVQQLYPHMRVQIDTHANAIVVLGAPDDVQAARTVVSGIDVKNPMQPTVEVVQLHVIKPSDLVAKVRPLFPNAAISVASKNSVLLRSTPLDGTQIKALIASLDEPPPSAAPPTSSPVEAVQVKQARPQAVARTIARQFNRVRVSVAGSTLLLRGDPDQVEQAKTLVAQVDQPLFGARYTEIYRLKNIDATSVGDLVSRTYPNAKVTVDKDLNAISVYAMADEHQRIADAIAQLDGAASGSGGAPGSGAAYGSGNIDVVHLKSAIPSQANGPSTTAQDIATAVTQSLGQMAPNLRLTVPANSDEIILAGDPTSIHLAEDLISKLDVVPPQVVLDTEVLEIDENDAKDLGLQLPAALLSTTFSETNPTPDPNGNLGRIIRLQPITRTPLSLTAQLNLLIQNGHGRVLADPRIATLSGKTASIRAGDTLAIITTSGGGVGTPVTQQLQTFNTGVTLDITPQISSNDDVTVALHPVVNSLEGISSSGVPQIATRDTQTTVHLHDDQTLVIGGLIQEADQHTTSVIPLLGQLPLVGRLFRNDDVSLTRNELVIVVTPHILKDGESPPAPDATMGLPTPQALPTLAPGTVLPNPRSVNEQPLPANNAPILNTPIPSPTPLPIPTPSAFAATNVYEYGTAPQNNYGGPQDQPQIFYARVSPTVLSASSVVSVDVVTTTNVNRVTIGTPGRPIVLTQTGAGKWSTSFQASQLALSTAQQTTFLAINAFRSDGVASTIQVPVSPQNP